MREVIFLLLLSLVVSFKTFAQMGQPVFPGYNPLEDPNGYSQGTTVIPESQRAQEAAIAIWSQMGSNPNQSVESLIDGHFSRVNREGADPDYKLPDTRENREIIAQQLMDSASRIEYIPSNSPPSGTGRIDRTFIHPRRFDDVVSYMEDQSYTLPSDIDERRAFREFDLSEITEGSPSSLSRNLNKLPEQHRAAALERIIPLEEDPKRKAELLIDYAKKGQIDSEFMASQLLMNLDTMDFSQNSEFMDIMLSSIDVENKIGDQHFLCHLISSKMSKYAENQEYGGEEELEDWEKELNATANKNINWVMDRVKQNPRAEKNPTCRNNQSLDSNLGTLEKSGLITFISEEEPAQKVEPCEKQVTEVLPFRPDLTCDYQGAIEFLQKTIADTEKTIKPSLKPEDLIEDKTAYSPYDKQGCNFDFEIITPGDDSETMSAFKVNKVGEKGEWSGFLTQEEVVLELRRFIDR